MKGLTILTPWKDVFPIALLLLSLKPHLRKSLSPPLSQGWVSRAHHTLALSAVFVQSTVPFSIHFPGWAFRTPHGPGFLPLLADAPSSFLCWFLFLLWRCSWAQSSGFLFSLYSCPGDLIQSLAYKNHPEPDGLYLQPRPFTRMSDSYFGLHTWPLHGDI